MPESAVKLADMISALRDQLVRAQSEGQDSPIRFNVAESELEIQFTVTKEAEAKGGVQFWVYEAGAGGKRASQSTQKIRLKLEPVDPDGKSTQISSTGKRSK